MKELRFLKAMFVMLLVMFASTAWGEEAILSVSSAFTSNGTLADDKNNTWNITSDGSYTGNSNYIQVGTNKSNVSYLKLSSNGYTEKAISKIQVWATSKASTNVTTKVSIGNNLLGTSEVYTTQNATSGGTEFSVENNNNYSGEILIEISRPSSAAGAIYFNKLIVTYTDGGGTVITPSPLSVPSNLSSSNVTSTSATLSWDAVENASSYMVKIGSTEYDANTNSYSATGLTAATDYTWSVKANGDGINYSDSEYSTEAEFRTLTPTTHNVIWSVNGHETTEEFAEGAVIIFYTPTSNIPEGYLFMGWYGSQYSHATEAPTYVTSATMGTSDVTYYAVFAKANEGGGACEWVRMSSVPSSEEGEYIIARETSGDDLNVNALQASISSNRFSNGNVQIKDNKAIAAPDSQGNFPSATIIWRISKNDGYYTLYNEETKKYAGATSKKNEGALLTDATDNLAKWTISYDGIFSIENYGRSQASTDNSNRYLRNNDGYGWAAYASGTGKAPVFYKKVSGTTYSDYCTSVAPPKSLSSISVTGTPTKITYNLGDTFNPAGLVVTAEYDDYSEEDVTEDVSWTFAPASFNGLGTVDIKATATYEGQRATYNGTVTVDKKDPPISIADMIVTVGDEEKISVVSTPTDAVLTYSITNGGEFVSIANGKVTGLKAGSATINANYAGNDEYKAKVVSFTVTVINTPTATIHLYNKDELKTENENKLEWVVDGIVTLTADKASSGTNANNYYPGTTTPEGNPCTSTRFYTGSTLTFTPATGTSLGTITYEATQTSYANALASSTWTNATAQASGKTVTITPTNGKQPIVATIGANTGGITFVVEYSKDEPLVAQFSVNGEIDENNSCKAYEGESITFPSNPSIPGYSFRGWIKQSIDGTQQIAPTFVNTNTEKMGNSGVTYYAVFASEMTAIFDASDLTNTPAVSGQSLTWEHTQTGIRLKLSAGSHYTNGLPNTFSVTAGTSNYFQISGNMVIGEIKTTLSAAEYKIGNVSNGASLSTDGTEQTVTSSNLMIIQCNATSSKQIRAKQITVYAYKDFCTLTRTLETISVKEGKNIYRENDKFDPSVLVINALYKSGDDEITEEVAYIGNESNFSFNPDLTIPLQITDEFIEIGFGGKTVNYEITVNPIPTHTAQFSVNSTIDTNQNCTVKEGASITFPSNPTISGYSFMGWRKDAIEGKSPADPGNYVTPANERMGTDDVIYYAVFATKTEGDNTWNEVTDLNSITEGTYVIVSAGFILPNNDTNTPDAIKDDNLSFENGVITGTVKSTYKWILTSSATNNHYYIKNASGKYLYTTDNNDGVRIGLNNYTWNFANNTKAFAMQCDDSNRYCGVYSSKDWRSYKDPTNGNYMDRANIHLYKFSSTTYSDFWTTLTQVAIVGNFNSSDDNNWLNNKMMLEQSSENANLYTGTISTTDWDSGKSTYEFKLMNQLGQTTELWTSNYQYDFSTKVEASTDAYTSTESAGAMEWKHNDAFSSYYVTAEYKTDEGVNRWHISIYGIRDSWDNIAIIGNFPNNNWDKSNPMVLPKIAENKFQGTINASSWTLENNPYKFKLYNNDYGIEWGSEGNMITFAETDEQIFAEGYSWAPMSWTHNTDYKSYFVKAEYKQSEDEIHYEWDVTITGIRDGAYLPGSWNEWITSDMGVRFEDDILVLSLEAEHLYEFKIFTPENCAWYGNSGTMTSENCTGWSFNQDANCSLQTTVAGDYIFYLKWNNGVPSITVEYPEDIKVDITSAKYATYYHSKRSYKVHKDLEGYIAYYDNGWKFENVYHPGDVVPAGVGIILKGNANTYKMALADKNENGAVYEKNRLEGTDVQTNLMDASDYDANSYYYALQKGKVGTANEGKVGMFWMNSAGDAFNNKAHKAYMRVPKSVFNGNEARLSGFAFEDEEATGVSEINVNIDGGDIYNLNGQRINTPVSGHIYIMNGHKFIAK